MKHPIRFALGTALALALAAPAFAAHPEAGVTLTHAWIRVLPGALPGGGYVTLRNDGNHAVKLVGADSPAYGQVMLHQSTTENGMSSMHAVKAIDVPAHGSVSFAPGGYHLMMMQAKTPVKPGQKVPVTLHFADGATLTAAFLARPANAVDDTH